MQAGGAADGRGRVGGRRRGGASRSYEVQQLAARVCAPARTTLTPCWPGWPAWRWRTGSPRPGRAYRTALSLQAASLRRSRRRCRRLSAWSSGTPRTWCSLRPAGLMAEATPAGAGGSARCPVAVRGRDAADPAAGWAGSASSSRNCSPGPRHWTGSCGSWRPWTGRRKPSAAPVSLPGTTRYSSGSSAIIAVGEAAGTSERVRSHWRSSSRRGPGEQTGVRLAGRGAGCSCGSAGCGPGGTGPVGAAGPAPAGGGDTAARTGSGRARRGAVLDRRPARRCGSARHGGSGKRSAD